MTFHYKIENQLLQVTFDYQSDTISTFKSIPSSIAKQYNDDLDVWEFSLSSIPQLNQFISIPQDIQQKAKDILQQQLLLDKIPDFTVKIEPSYTYLIVNKKHIEYDWKSIDDVCTFEILNAKYTFAYKSGNWDGKYHLFNRRNKSFPTGLLDKVLKILFVLDYTYQLQNLIIYPPLLQYRWEIQHLQFRDYQLDVINTALEKKHGILQLPTGAGKTIIAVGLIKEFGIRTLFLVHTKDLLYQTYQKFTKFFSNVKIGLVGDGHADIQPITIATVQTLSPKIPFDETNYGDYKYDVEEEYDEEDIVVIRQEKPTNITTERVLELLNQTQLIICDESHHSPAQTFYRILMRIKSPYKFGLSATPFREDGFQMKIEAGLGDIIYRMNVSDLIERKILVKPHIKFVRVPAITYPRKNTYAQIYQKYIVDNIDRNEIIASLAKAEMEKGKQILILVKQIRHLNILQEMIPTSQIIEGKLKTHTRKELLEMFLNKKYQVLIATSLADEGLDIPTLDVLILAGAGKSSTKALQRIGRVLRLGDKCDKCGSFDVRIVDQYEPCICSKCGNIWKYHGKTHAIVYDFMDQTKMLIDQYYKRKGIYEQEKEFEISYHKVKFE